MKSKIKIFFVAFIVVPIVAVLALVPLYVERDNVQKSILDKAREKSGYTLDGAHARWRWLPFPHISLRDITIKNNLGDWDLPIVDLYPDWSAAANQEFKISTIELINPVLLFSPAEKKQQSTKKQATHLPKIKLSVKNGTFKIDTLLLPGLFKQKVITVSGINAEMMPERNSIKIFLQCASGFCKRLTIQGKFNIETLTYKLEVNANTLELNETFISILKGKIIPVNSQSSIKGSIEGVGLKNINASFTGTLPCLAVQPTDKKVLVNCGVVDFDFKKEGPNFTTRINDLELKQPGGKLHGIIKRTVWTPGAASQAGLPIWDIDLQGDDLNLDDIRGKVLRLWGDHKTAQVVCNIVRGGLAKKVSYSFHGPSKGLRHIKNMSIEADILTAQIFIPGNDLLLKRCQGPIKITGGYLTGKGLKATLGKSSAQNGSLLLDLVKEQLRPFSLEMDLDADLEDVPEVLKKTVKKNTFLEELNKIEVLNGKARAHLKIGDALGHIQVKLHADQVNTAIYYDRVKEIIEIKNGRLQLVPNKVSWQNISGQYGPHKIHNLKGEVTWTDDVQINIAGLEATVDAETLYQELLDIPLLNEHVSNTLEAMNGTLKVTNGSLHGPAKHPDMWRYEFDVKGGNLKWRSPLLTGEAQTENLAASLTDKRLVISELKGKIADSSMTITGNLEHDHFRNWHGHLNFNGTVYNELAGWVNNKKWLPPTYFPKIPCTLTDLTVAWSAGQTDINGQIIAGSGSDQLPALSLDIKATPGHLNIKELRVKAEDGDAALSFDSLDRAAETFLLKWDGAISAATMTKLFRDQDSLQGSINGNCRIVVSAKSGANAFSGNLTATNLPILPAIKKNPVLIKNLQLKGTGSRLRVKKLLLNLGGKESIAAEGKISLHKNTPELDLELTSDSLTSETLSRFYDALTGHETPNGKQARKTAPNISGNIKFTADNFTWTVKNFSKAKPVHSYYLQPFKGRVRLYPGQGMAVDILSAQTCCLDLTGTWHSSHVPGRNSFKISSSCQPLPWFQGSLPCLGIEQDMIEGTFSLNSNLEGEPGHWKDGNLSIHSEGGRILRMRLLAKIFKVVNLTDLFNVEGESGKSENTRKGFAYKKMEFETEIKNNVLIIKKGVIYGEGLNILVRGKMNLGNWNADFTVLVAPLKTLDTIISSLPIIGRVLTGEDKTFFAIPVGVKGPISNPEITVLPASAIGDALLNLVKGTLNIPKNIISPMLPKEKKQSSE